MVSDGSMDSTMDTEFKPNKLGCSFSGTFACYPL